MGYHRAGFDIVGVDIKPQRFYPFPFIAADALEYLKSADLSQVSAIHASPPCQKYTRYQHQSKRDHPDLIATVREALIKSGLPYVIENVEGAPLLNPVLLCGSHFEGLRVKRHRLFESNLPLVGTTCQHERWPKDIPIFNRGWRYSRFVPVYGMTGGGKRKDLWGPAMGIDWMKPRELAQAIPPAYTEWIGHQLRQSLQYDPPGGLDTPSPNQVLSNT